MARVMHADSAALAIAARWHHACVYGRVEHVIVPAWSRTAVVELLQPRHIACHAQLAPDHPS